MEEKRKKRKVRQIQERDQFEQLIHKWNPQLEHEFGPYLLNEMVSSVDILKSLISWDNLVDRLLGRSTEANELQLSIERIEPLHEAHISFFLLLLETVEPEILNVAIFSGFFPFAIGLEFDSKIPSEDCGLVALELSGLSPDKSVEDMGGRSRIILHEISDLIIGKRAVKEISKLVKDDSLLSFSLTWSTDWSDINEAWEILITHHGINWLGYSRIRASLKGLYELIDREIQLIVFRINQERLSGDSNLDSSCQCSSLEIGYITGSCYTSLSNWSDSSISRIGQIRSASIPLLLHQWGVKLFDVGVTADYYLNFNGYHRSTREEFVNLWRQYRSVPLTSNTGTIRKVDVLKLLLDNKTR